MLKQLLITGIIVCLIGCSGTSGGSDDSLAKSETKANCIALLKAKLGVPSDAKFPSLLQAQDNITKTTDGYKWSDWVEFAGARKYFSCETDDINGTVKAEWND